MNARRSSSSSSSEGELVGPSLLEQRYSSSTTCRSELPPGVKRKEVSSFRHLFESKFESGTKLTSILPPPPLEAEAGSPGKANWGSFESLSELALPGGLLLLLL